MQRAPDFTHEIPEKSNLRTHNTKESQPPLDSKLHSSLDNYRFSEYEIDQRGILLKSSIVMALIILLIGASTVVSTFLSGCMEGLRRRKRIKDWESSHKGVSSPKKYTQSFGEPETDVEMMVGA